MITTPFIKDDQIQSIGAIVYANSDGFIYVALINKDQFKTIYQWKSYQQSLLYIKLVNINRIYTLGSDDVHNELRIWELISTRKYYRLEYTIYTKDNIAYQQLSDKKR